MGSKSLSREIDKCISQAKTGSTSDSWIAKKQFATVRRMKKAQDPYWTASSISYGAASIERATQPDTSDMLRS